MTHKLIGYLYLNPSEPPRNLYESPEIEIGDYSCYQDGIYVNPKSTADFLNNIKKYNIYTYKPIEEP